MIHVLVDVLRCEGHGVCESAAPDIFALDDGGVSTVLLDPIPDELLDRANAGVQACPVAALRFDRLPDRRVTRAAKSATAPK